MRASVGGVLGSIALIISGSAACRSDGAKNDREPVASYRLSVDSVPTTSIAIGESSELEGLSHVIGSARLSDGTLLVVDGYPGHEQSLKAFSGTGSFLWSAGRQGGGPGEFQAVTWSGHCARDRVFTWDGAKALLSIFDGRGKLVRESRLPVTPVQINMTCSRAGKLAMMTAPAPSSPVAEEFPRLAGTLVLSNDKGDSLWALANISLGQNRVLGTVTRLALSEDRLYVGTGDSAYVDVYDVTGKRVATFRVGDTPSAPNRAQYQRAVDQVLNLLPGTPGARRVARERLLQVPMPDRLPPYSAMLVDPSGILWIVTSPPGEPSTEIRAFTGTGDSLGTLSLPAAVQLFEIGADYILGAAATGDGEALVMYALHRS